MQDTDLPEKIEPTSLNLQTELAAQLAELVPEAMSDGKLDVSKLRELVNGDAENSPEKFGLFWPGKRAAQALERMVQHGVNLAAERIARGRGLDVHGALEVVVGQLRRVFGITSLQRLGRRWGGQRRRRHGHGH